MIIKLNSWIIVKDIYSITLTLQELLQNNMAKITEQDIIVFLKDKVESLKAELNKAQSALEAFTNSGVTAPSKAVAEPRVPSAPRTRKTAPKKEVKAMVVPESYDEKLKLDSKIAYVLSQNGPLFNTEIIERLQGQEPDKDADKLSKAVTVKLSALHKAGRIKGAKVGRKFKYEL